MNPAEQARIAVNVLLAAFAKAQTTGEREDVAREIARLTPNGERSLSELAKAALAAARDE